MNITLPKLRCLEKPMGPEDIDPYVVQFYRASLPPERPRPAEEKPVGGDVYRDMAPKPPEIKDRPPVHLGKRRREGPRKSKFISEYRSRHKIGSMRGPQYPWTEDSEARLLQLYAEGVTLSTIADLINQEFPSQHAQVTRNSVCGKIDRLTGRQARRIANAAQ